jgi:hypothetical protein
VLAFKPGTTSSVSEVLAGEASGHDVNGRTGLGCPPRRRRSDIFMPGHLRPVLREYLAAPRVDLDLAGDRHPGPLQAEVQAADAAEEGQDVHDLTAGTSPNTVLSSG